MCCKDMLPEFVGASLTGLQLEFLVEAQTFNCTFMPGRHFLLVLWAVPGGTVIGKGWQSYGVADKPNKEPDGPE